MNLHAAWLGSADVMDSRYWSWDYGYIIGRVPTYPHCTYLRPQSAGMQGPKICRRNLSRTTLRTSEYWQHAAQTGIVEDT